MKVLNLIFALMLVAVQAHGQSGYRSVPDSLMEGELTEETFDLLSKETRYIRSEDRYPIGRRLLNFAQKNDYSAPKIAFCYRVMSQGKTHTDADSFLYFNRLASLSFEESAASDRIWPILTYERAEHYNGTAQYDSMLYYIDKTLAYESAREQVIILSAALLLKSNFHKSEGRYDSAQIVLIEALNLIAERNPDHPAYNRVRGAIHVKLGTLYRRSGNSYEYRRKLDQGLSMLKDSTSKVIILGNLADSYQESAQYDSAHVFALRAHDYAHDVESYNLAYRRLAQTYTALGKYRIAARMKDSLDKYNQLASGSFAKKLVANHEGALRVGLGEVAKGRELFRSMFPKDSAFLGNWNTVNYLDYIKAMIPHQDQSATVNQLDTLKRLIHLSSQESTAEVIEDVRIKYETEKKEQENLLLTQQRDFEAQRNQTLRNVSIGSLLFTALLAALAWLLYGRNKQLSVAKQNISRLNQELNHRATNNLRNVKLLLKDQCARAVTAGLDESAVNELERKILAYTKLQEKLNTNLTHINLASYLDDFCEHLREAFSSNGKPVHFSCNIDDVNVSPDFAAPLALIINELATNSLKYAHREDGVLSISLDAVIDVDNELRVYYRDGGPADGPVNPETYSSGKGMEFVREFTEQLEGEIIRYGNKQGFDYEAVFAMAA